MGSLSEKAINKRGLTVGATVMVLTQIVMVAIMLMTPIHMKHHGYGLSEVGIVYKSGGCHGIMLSIIDWFKSQK
ncbi:hypothetical protein LSPCS325_32890 [Lysinibacillus sp. CTST325]